MKFAGSDLFFKPVGIPKRELEFEIIEHDEYAKHSNYCIRQIVTRRRCIENENFATHFYTDI